MDSKPSWNASFCINIDRQYPFVLRMNKAVKYLFSLIVIPLTSFGQKRLETTSLNRVTINYNDTTIVAHLAEYGRREKVSPLKYYYWCKANHILVTQGGYSGKLLHGDYRSYYPNDNLKTFGKFSNGLKSGVWRNWDENGALLSVYTWKSGKRDGSFKIYNGVSHQVLKEGNYRNGLLNGRVVEYFSNDSSRAFYYKKGEPVKKSRISNVFKWRRKNDGSADTDFDKNKR